MRRFAFACLGLCAAAHAATLPAVARRDIADLGPAGAETQVELAITLPFRDVAGLERLALAQATPGSPLFHHFLTGQDFTTRFAPSDAEADSVMAALRHAGFARVSLSASRTVVLAEGSAPVASAYFQTDIHRVAQSGHGSRYANLASAHMPDELAGHVLSVVGLDNLVKFTPHHQRAAISPASAMAPSLYERIQNGNFAGLYASALSAAYRFPQAGSGNGQHRGIGIVVDSDVGPDDLPTYWAAAGVHRTGIVQPIYVHGAAPGASGDVVEAEIDTEISSSLAPSANIYILEVPAFDDVSVMLAYLRAIHETSGSVAKMDVISSSFGVCELAHTAMATATDALALQGAALGMTFTASTGDNGGFCAAENRQGVLDYNTDSVSIPAANPHFLAVGGTTLRINPATGARIAENAWTPGGLSGGGGGGVSSFWPVPSYQASLSGIAVVPDVHVTAGKLQPRIGFQGRNVPDIALNASTGIGSYMAIYNTLSGWVGYGGTSVSSPAMAALIAEQNKLTGTPSGFYNQTLYALFTGGFTQPDGVYGQDFYDVTKGSIGAGWSARAGYDQATGIGSVLRGGFRG
jgi:kumamolisin